MSEGGHGKRRRLDEIPASPRWREEVVGVGKVPAESLPHLRGVVTGPDIANYLGRKEVRSALKLPEPDLEFTHALAFAGNEPLRRRGITLDPILYRSALASHLEQRTGVNLRSYGSLRFEMDEDRLRRTVNHNIDPAGLDEAEKIIFASPNIQRPGWRDLLDYESLFFTGAYVSPNGHTTPTTIGKPLNLVDDVGFYFVKVPDMQESIQGSPYGIDSKLGVMVPIVGKIVGEDGDLSDEKLKDFGFTRLEDSRGKPVKYPLFATTTRSVLQFCNLSLIIPYVDGKPRILNNTRVMEDIIRDLGGEPWVEELHRYSEGSLKQAYAENKPDMTYAEYKKVQYGHALVYTGLEILQSINHPDIMKRIRFEPIPCCAIKFKGSGCYHYDGHHVKMTEEELKNNPNLRLHEKEDTGNRYVVDERYEGRYGIILPVAHQDIFGVPVGAASTSEALSYEREQKILENGGKLSEMTTGLVKLLDKKQAPELEVDAIGVSIIAVLDDTRRMNDFADKGTDLETRKGFYKAFAIDKYGRGGRETFEGCRDAHMTEFFENLGKTTQAILASGLTNPFGQDLFGNISVSGGIADTKNLAGMNNPNQAIGVYAMLVADLNEFGKTAGYGDGKIFKTPQCQKMLSGMFGADAEKIIEYTNKPHFARWSGRDAFTRVMMLGGLMTDAWVRRCGGQVGGYTHQTDRELLDVLYQDEGLWTSARVDRETLLALYIAHSRPTVKIHSPEGKKATVGEALEEVRTNLDDRIRKVPTIEENAKAAEQHPV